MKRDTYFHAKVSFVEGNSHLVRCQCKWLGTFCDADMDKENQCWTILGFLYWNHVYIQYRYTQCVWKEANFCVPTILENKWTFNVTGQCLIVSAKETICDANGWKCCSLWYNENESFDSLHDQFTLITAWLLRMVVEKSLDINWCLFTKTRGKKELFKR